MTLVSTNQKIDDAASDHEDNNYIVGVVIDNEDPKGINRIKVTIPNLLSGKKEELPWIGPLPYSPFGIGQGYGVYGSPAIGSEVAIKFQNNDIHYGILEGSLLTVKNANAKFKSPKTWGFKDPDGNELYVNMETHVWEFTTHTGTTLKHTAQGDFNLNIVRDQTSTINRNETTNVTGDSTKNVTGNTGVTTTGNLNITTTGTTTLTSTGSLSVNTSGNAAIQSTADMSISSSGGVVTISGSNVNLN